MADAYLALEAIEDQAVFHVRLGLAVIDVVGSRLWAAPVTARVEDAAVRSGDAYAAIRDPCLNAAVLDHRWIANADCDGPQFRAGHWRHAYEPTRRPHAIS